jgi:hypothetical protein
MTKEDRNDGIRKLRVDLKVGKPEIAKYFDNPEINHYGYQECFELIDGHWEGFVTLIKTKEVFEKRMAEYNRG